MKIMFVSAEVAPFSKVGGLADVVGSWQMLLAVCPKFLKKWDTKSLYLRRCTDV